MTPPNDQGRSDRISNDDSRHPAARKPRWLGWLLAGLVAALLVAAGISTRHRPTSATTQPAGAAPFDVDKARLQTKDLQAQAMQAIGRKQDTSDLLTQTQKLVERYPRFAPAYTLLGQLYLQAGEPAKAYDALDRSLDFDNQQPEVHKLAGTLAMGQGQYDKAVHHFELAAGLEPANAEYRVFLAQCYIQQHQDDKARVTLLQALKINSNLHEAYHALSTLDARQGHLDQAITQSSRALDHLSSDLSKDRAPRVTYTRWLAKLLQRDNRPADSLRVLEKLPEDQRLTAPVLEDMAVAWEMLGQPAKGAALYEDALGHHADQWPLALGAARWYLKAHDQANAQRMADALRRINPSAPALKDLTAKIQAASGK
jgi:tetratricopeptide (TPR) repeat protein